MNHLKCNNHTMLLQVHTVALEVVNALVNVGGGVVTNDWCISLLPSTIKRHVSNEFYFVDFIDV